MITKLRPLLNVLLISYVCLPPGSWSKTIISVVITGYTSIIHQKSNPKVKAFENSRSSRIFPKIPNIPTKFPKFLMEIYHTQNSQEFCNPSKSSGPHSYIFIIIIIFTLIVYMLKGREDLRYFPQCIGSNGILCTQVVMWIDSDETYLKFQIGMSSANFAVLSLTIHMKTLY